MSKMVKLSLVLFFLVMSVTVVFAQQNTLYPPASYGGTVPSPTPAPTPSGGANLSNVYVGCSMFPGTAGGNSGGWYDTDISGAAVMNSVTFLGDGTSISSNASTTLINNAFSQDSGGFVMNLPPIELINTPATVTLDSISSCPGGSLPLTCSLPGPSSQWSGSPIPALPNMFWEAAAGFDGHLNTIATSNCNAWAATIFSFSGGVYDVFDSEGLTYDLSKPFPQPNFSVGLETCCGLPVFAIAIKPAELRTAINGNSFLHHALAFELPGNENGVPAPADPNGFLAPASESQGIVAGTPTCSTSPNCMPYGAHLRLKASFNDSGFSPAAKVVAETLKRYGMYFFDTGCCNELARLVQDDSGIDISTLWTGTDGTNIQSINLSNFEVVAPSVSNAAN